MTQNTAKGRRSFLKRIGAAGVGMTLAGCTGSGGGGDGGDGGDGGGGDGGATTDGGSMELTDVSLTAGANPWIVVEGNYMVEQGILQEKFESLGFNPTLEFTYGGPSLFASGQTDIAGIGPTESVIMATQREFDIVVPGKTFKATANMMVRPGSPYDPAEVGGQKQAMQNVAEDGVFGIGGWEGADVKLFSVLFPEAFDLDFRQEGGDFTVNSTGDYASLPQLIVDGELDIGDAVMTLNGYPHFHADPPRLANFAYLPDLLNKFGFNGDAFNGIVARKEFADQNPDLLEAYVESWQEAADWFFDNPLTAVQNSLDAFGGIPEEDAEFVADFGAGETEYANQPVFYETVALEDQWLEREKKFLDLGVDKGSIPSGWEDWVEFRQY